MKSFFKYFFASLLAMVLAFLVVILIISGAIAGIMSGSDKTVTIKENSTLVMEMNRRIVDRASNNPFQNFDVASLTGMEGNSTMGLNTILTNLKKAKEDPNIKGIFIKPERLSAGWATIEEVRNALIDFKESGKFIISYANFYTQPAYYLASVADKIYLNPEGSYTLSGLSAQLMFFKNTLEKLGIEPQIIRHGRFKAAVEPFMLTEMSKENRLQTETYIGSIWNHMLAGISKERGIDVVTLQKYTDNLDIRQVSDAVKANLIDGAKYYDEVANELKMRTDSTSKEEFIAFNFNKYENTPKLKTDKLITDLSKIAVIYAQGEIGMEKGTNEKIGLENIAKALSEARKDEKIKAIVLRINSPGGSALTSEVILREAMLAHQEKPLIVSMGDVAASGGYYIACAADTIVASPNTITGSIGVFGLMFNAQKLMNNKLGITTSTVKTGKLADMGTQTRKLTPLEYDIIQQDVIRVYKTFVNHVSRARNMSFDEVDEIGEGRVWTGSDAKEIGLVDVWGGLNTAIAIAAEKANLDDYRIVELPKQKDPFAQLLASMEEGVYARIFDFNSEISRYSGHVFNALNMKGIQTRMEYDLDIK
ncbi:MAG: signal peptide peptidase SppA [Salinivirgaceae bacterium]|nr:signal peptide peptidase SppA [Salinivirgaceae bacterium]